MSTVPAIRLKTHWFKPGAPKTPAQQAGAMGFTIWRVALQTLKRMRGADFDIDAGEPYFAFMREVLVFLVAVADRLAHERFDSATRVAFTTALVLHVADTLHGNEVDLMGEPAAGQPQPCDRFIDLYNEVSGHYGEFGGEAGKDEFTPDFSFLRYLGHRLEPTLPPEHRRWVIDQVMAIEAPEAVGKVQQTLRDLCSTAPRRMRHSSVSGE
jgi:hypothetical protein